MNGREKEANKQFANAVGEWLDKVDHPEGEEDFAQMFESYQNVMSEDLQIGDKVRGEIISIGMDTVFVNTGTKIDGAVGKEELLDDDGQLPYQVGDTLELYVVGIDENEIRLSKALSGIGGLNMIRDAYEGRVPVEGKVIQECKGGFHVEIFKRRAFCPISQMDTRYVENATDYVGQVLHFLVVRFEENGRNIVVSRRELLMKELQQAKAEFMKQVVSDAVLDGRVTNLMDYGAFVELFPGIEGMVHISELSWSRVKHPSEVVNIDDPVKVRVLSVESTDKPEQPKISLSIKQVTGDPWEQEELPVREGEKIQGKVTRCADFGAFVEIFPGIEGLVHISEMSYVKRVLRAEDVVQPGDIVDVMVKDIDRERRRISLSMKDAEGDPWIGIQDRYPVGQAVQGKLEKKERFGYFISLEPGITGLLPISKIKAKTDSAALDRLKVGDTVSVVVESVDIDGRKVSLAPADADTEDDWRQFTVSQTSGQLGELGEKLRKALEGKK